MAIAQRHVRLHLCDDPREVERLRVATRIPFGIDGERDTGGPEFTVTQLQRDVAAVDEELGLFERARKVACAEAFSKCRRFGPWAKVAIEEASSRAELEHRMRIDRPADGHAAAFEAKAGEVLDAGVVAQAEVALCLQVQIAGVQLHAERKVAQRGRKEHLRVECLVGPRGVPALQREPHVFAGRPLDRTGPDPKPDPAGSPPMIG